MSEVSRLHKVLLAGVSLALLMTGAPALAQDAKTASASPSSSAAATATTPEPLTDDELEELVARIALYPDELVAAIARPQARARLSGTSQ